jgi:flagellar biosynthetic protein FliO
LKLNLLLCRACQSASGWVIGGLGCVLSYARAASAAVFAAPTPEPLPGSTGGLVRVTVALIVVLGAVLLAAWFARRVRGLTAVSSPNLQLLAQLSLGARERAVLLRVGEREVLVGVSPGNVRTLYVLDGSATPASISANSSDAQLQRPNFKSLLLKSLGK